MKNVNLVVVFAEERRQESLATFTKDVLPLIGENHKIVTINGGIKLSVI